MKSFGGDVKMKILNILVTGVGGQGIITFGRILSEVYRRKDIRVLMAETHGMSQRGGSVEVHIRIGDVYSSLVPEGGANIIVGLELIEAVRSLRYANPNTVILTNVKMIRPGLPRVKMPDMHVLLEYINSLGLKSYTLPAHDFAIKAGNVLSVNMVMLGALVGSNLLHKIISLGDLEDIVLNLPMKEVNLKALKYGYEFIAKSIG